MNCGLYPSGRPNVVKTSEILRCPGCLLKNCSNAVAVRLDGASLVSSSDGRDRLHDQGVDAAYVGELKHMTSSANCGQSHVIDRRYRARRLDIECVMPSPNSQLGRPDWDSCRMRQTSSD